MSSILGISAFYHDSAAVIINDGEIIAAAQEERFTRRKHDPRFPKNAIDFVLKEAKLSINQLDCVVFYEKPLLKFERLLETYLANAPRGFNSFKTAMPIWIREKIFQKKLLVKELQQFSKKFNEEKLLFSEHHMSHAASAFYPSPFKNAVILTLDGVGEWATTTVSIGKEETLNIIKEIHFPHSLGLLYSAFTYFTGFKVNSGEYKVMGLAPYGVPKYKELILEKIIDLKDDGSFRLNQSYFNYTTGLTMTNKQFSNLFGYQVRKPETDELSEFHMDIAASIQEVTEEVVVKIIKRLSVDFEIRNLCLSGGVALNCVANSKILKSGYFDNIWVQPAAGDAGGALGAALTAYYQELNNSRNVTKKDSMQGTLLGPCFSADYIKKVLEECGAKFETLDDLGVIESTVKALEKGKAIGWFQGRMEFGPRALGARSIIADARSETMQKNLNLKVKFRESFRPFAPSVLREDVNDWFELDCDSPYMLFVSDVQKRRRHSIKNGSNDLLGIEKINVKRSDIPAVTHVDYSARIQTVDKEINPKFHNLISAFKKKTGCPVIVNTSFNVRGEPIVCKPEEAYRCFMGTGLDMLVIENFVMYKENQNVNLFEDYKDKYDLD